jgi:hypothetical protein
MGINRPDHVHQDSIRSGPSARTVRTSVWLLALACAGFVLAVGWGGATRTSASQPGNDARAKSTSFPWHRTPMPIEAPAQALLLEGSGMHGIGSVPGAAGATLVQIPEALLADRPDLVRAEVLSRFRLAQFDWAGAYIHARRQCLLGGWEGAEMGCDPVSRANDDSAALALLEAGAARCLPDAELALAEWWVLESARLYLANLSAQKSSPSGFDNTPPALEELRRDAQHARERALTTLARAAPHNADAATRLEELRTAWASLD